VKGDDRKEMVVLNFRAPPAAAVLDNRIADQPYGHITLDLSTIDNLY
jgi:hypothetical protein